jgi:tRNA(fMet)-specific endonuclease VapC
VLNAFLRNLENVDFPDGAATHYASIRATLKRRGAVTGANDLLIAAHARCLQLTLVTHNTGEYERIEGLALENWA